MNKYPQKWIDALCSKEKTHDFLLKVGTPEEKAKVLLDILNLIGAINLPKKRVIFECSPCGNLERFVELTPKLYVESYCCNKCKQKNWIVFEEVIDE